MDYACIKEKKEKDHCARENWNFGEMFAYKLVLEGLSSSRERPEIPFAVYQSSPLRMKLETSNTNIQHWEWELGQDESKPIC